MRISALNRGGLAVHNGHYDPHKNEAILQVRTGETVTVTVEYQSAPTSPSIAATGVTATDPTISGNKVSTTLSGFLDYGRADISATVDGQTRIVRVRIKADGVVDGYDLAVSSSGDGTLDFEIDGNILLTV